MVPKLLCAFALVMTSQASLAPETVLARVGGQNLSVADFRDVIISERRTGDSTRVMQSFTPEGQRRVLQQLIDARLLADGAREQKLDADPEVQRAVSRAVDAVLAESLIRVEIQKLNLNDAALQHYYDTHPDQFRTAKRVKARHIVVYSRVEAEQVRAELRKGADFGEIAADRNTDASKPKRGELGWISRGVMVRPFEDAVFALPAGETSPIVQTFAGFHIIQVEEIDPGKLMPFGSVRERVRQQVVEEQISATKRALATKHSIWIDEAALKGALR